MNKYTIKKGDKTVTVKELKETKKTEEIKNTEEKKSEKENV